jgi:hypothetical protein
MARIYKGSEMTCNRLMVLLAIYRGTDDQQEIGTYKDDLDILKYAGLICLNKGTGWDWNCTDKGRELVKNVFVLCTCIMDRRLCRIG